MKVLIFGATGMVGQGVLRACLLDPEVSEVVSVVRAPTGRSEPKLREIVHADFADFTGFESDADACFWCVGVTSAGMSEADYTRVTHDYALAAAKAIARPTMTLVFVSGAGADGNAMWARVKRKTEQALAALPFRAVYVFRPAMIQALHGIKSRTRLYNVLYPVISPLMMVTRRISPKYVTDTDRVGRAMLRVARAGYAKHTLENGDINEVAGA